MPISQACELATEKSKNWIALLTIGGSILVMVIVLAAMGLAFAIPEVTDFLMTLHESGMLYLIVIGGVILVVMALMERNTKASFCPSNM